MKMKRLRMAAALRFRAIKREYYKICLDLLEDLRREKGLQFSGRLAVLGLFGMINWIYTWHNPRVDLDAGAMAEEMSNLFLRGVLNPGKDQTKNRKDQRLTGRMRLATIARILKIIRSF